MTVRYLETREVHVSELQPYPGNPRRGNVRVIVQSLLRSLQYRSVIARRIDDGLPVVLAGNHTTQAASELVDALRTAKPHQIARRYGVAKTTVEAFLASGSPLLEGRLRVELVDCDDDAAARVVAVDNRAADLGEYDTVDLAMLLDGITDLEGTGYEQADLDRLLALAAGEPSKLTAEDDAPAKPLQSLLTATGDLWVLGEHDEHRLLVGDATLVDDVERLCDGVKVDLLVTDPPYGVAYQSADGKTIANDDLDVDGLRELLDLAFGNAFTVMRPGAPYYVFGPSGRLETTFRLALDPLMEIRQQLVWVKNRHVLGRADYHGRHETILYGWRGPDGEPVDPPYDVAHDTVLYGWKAGAAHTWEGGRKQSTVWEFPRPARSVEHPTMKPVQMLAAAVTNSSQPGAVVLDLFVGSGSTLIACHGERRRCRAMELDPAYAEVVLRRWQAHTGDVPRRVLAGGSLERVSFVDEAAA